MPKDLIIDEDMIALLEFTDVIYQGRLVKKIENLWKKKDI